MWKIGKKDPNKEKEKMLYEARMSLANHEASLEYHAHMVAMYKERIDRLDPQIEWGEVKK